MALIAGAIEIKVNGEVYEAKGAFDLKLGGRMYKKIVGVDSIIGTKTEYVVPTASGKITDDIGLSVKELQQITGATVTFRMVSGKVYLFEDADFSSDANINTEEGEIDFAIEAADSDEII